jgi:anti-sigma factor ChrR (cupin superfamily)
MRINADFSRPALVTPDQHQWVPSPQQGVDRIMLDRIGEEKARATSIVRYAPNSNFPVHSHPGGEEVLVLSGTFSEGDTHYPAGWYLRNPPGSSHQPGSAEGTVIFVKLWQMLPSQTRSVRIDTGQASAWQRSGDREICPLYNDDHETVSLQRLASGQALFCAAVPGAELLLLAGSLVQNGQAYPNGSWLRLPPGNHADILAGPDGATVYLKTGQHPGA